MDSLTIYQVVEHVGGRMRKEASELIGDNLEAELVLQIQGWGPNAQELATEGVYVLVKV